jgi:hypothetical protein
VSPECAPLRIIVKRGLQLQHCGRRSVTYASGTLVGSGRAIQCENKNGTGLKFLRFSIGRRATPPDLLSCRQQSCTCPRRTPHWCRQVTLWKCYQPCRLIITVTINRLETRDQDFVPVSSEFSNPTKIFKTYNLDVPVRLAIQKVGTL